MLRFSRVIRNYYSRSLTSSWLFFKNRYLKRLLSRSNKHVFLSNRKEISSAKRLIANIEYFPLEMMLKDFIKRLFVLTHFVPWFGCFESFRLILFEINKSLPLIFALTYFPCTVEWWQQARIIVYFFQRLALSQVPESQTAHNCLFRYHDCLQLLHAKRELERLHLLGL